MEGRGPRDYPTVFRADGSRQEEHMMRRWRVVVAAVFAFASALAWPATARADAYDDAVGRAEALWESGKKTEAVALYGRVWNLKPNDVDGQILYAGRSAEVRNFKWALNFYRVAEVKVKDDPTRLYRVYAGYAQAYRLAGQVRYAQLYEEKAARLRDSGQVKDTPPPGGTSEAAKPKAPKATPSPPPPAATTATAPQVESIPPSVTVLKTSTRFLKKRIAVAPIGVAGGGAALAPYAKQVHAMLTAELRNSTRFVVVERENMEAILAAQSSAAPDRAGKNTAARTGNPVGAQLLVKAEITGFEDLSARPRGAGPADAARAQNVLRVTMDVQIVDAGAGAAIASERIAAEKAPAAGEAAANVSAFRYDDRDSQTSTLGFVTSELVQKALERIFAHSAKIPWMAQVIRVSGDEVYINAGSPTGARAGDRFRVFSAGAAPAPQEKMIGEIELTRVEEKFAVGRIVSKKGEIKRLDNVMEI